MNPRLEPGDQVIVSLAEIPDGPQLRARVRESEGSAITLRAPDCPFQTGARVRLDIVVAGDARYAVEARLRHYRDRVLTLDPNGAWVRVQRREFFRVRSGAVPVQVLRDQEHRSELDARHKTSLYDISGGGAQLETDLALEEGESIIVKFRLPSIKLNHVIAVVDEEEVDTAVEVDVPARVVRVVKISAGRKRRIGVRFSGVSPQLRQQLLRWIYTVQSHRRAREVDSGLEI